MKKNLLLFIFSFVFLSQSFGAFVTTSKESKTEEVTANPNAENGIPTLDAAKSAMKEFKNLSRHEKKDRLKEAKKQLQQLKAEKKAGSEPSTNTVLLVILAILLPPLAVYLHPGEINTKFWISLLLTLLFFLPGVIYALLVVLGEV